MCALCLTPCQASHRLSVITESCQNMALLVCFAQRKRSFSIKVTLWDHGKLCVIE